MNKRVGQDGAIVSEGQEISSNPRQGEVVPDSPAVRQPGAVPLSVTAAPATATALETCASCGEPIRAQRGSPVEGRTSTGGWSGRVYAVGQLAPQFPSIDIEKEFAQLAAGVGNGMTETALLREVISAPENRYLARHMCWVFTAQQVEAFAVLPREEADVIRLVELMPSTDADAVMHVVVGRSVPPGWIDSPCAESGLPTVVADQLLGFTLDEFAEALPDTHAASAGERPSGADAPRARTPAAGGASREQFQTIVREVFHRLTRRSDNRGIADEHRALNYLALRYPPLYHAVTQAYGDGKMLVGIHARHSHSGDRRLVSVGLAFRHRRTDITERYQCVVDVTGFPFLVSGLELTFE